ncbi:MAG: hypothetical protein EOP45_05710 [Sphingobacteriaceae bacterium]|nr:MAG: hypothetical protein EOP45_05710 [Sphingobacteriaceae bacterium]
MLIFIILSNLYESHFLKPKIAENDGQKTRAGSEESEDDEESSGAAEEKSFSGQEANNVSSEETKTGH